MTWNLQENEASATLCRFGASAAKHCGLTAVIGGIAPANLTPEGEDIIFLDASKKQKQATIALPSTRPLLVGHSVASTKEGLVVMGGGAVCFSMGTFVNKGCYTIMPARSETGCYTFMLKGEDSDETECTCDVLAKPPVPYQYFETLEHKPESKKPSATLPSSVFSTAHESVAVRRRKISSPSEFASIMTAAQPVILEGLNLGPCTESWKDDYLLDKIGRDRSVCTSLIPPFVSALLTPLDCCAPRQHIKHGFRLQELHLRN